MFYEEIHPASSAENTDRQITTKCGIDVRVKINIHQFTHQIFTLFSSVVINTTWD